MSSKREPTIDREVRAVLRDEKRNEAKASATWDEIEAEARPILTARGDGMLDAAPGRGRSRHHGRKRLVLAGSGVLAAVALGVALLPLSQDEGSGPVGLDEASAAEVLGQAAESTDRLGSLVPGPGQVLYSRRVERTGSPADGGDWLRVATQEWIYPSGAAVAQVDTAGSPDKAVRPDVASPSTATRQYFTKDGRTQYGTGPGETWRVAMRAADLRDIPVDPAGALAAVRRAAGAMDYVGSKADRDQYGTDLLATATIVSLLAQAPLEADQRAALFEVLATAPDWFRSGDGVALSMGSLGPRRTHEGREGIGIRVKLQLPAGEPGAGSPGIWTLDVISDLDRGQILETVETEPGSKPTVTSYDPAKVIPRGQMPISG